MGSFDLDGADVKDGVMLGRGETVGANVPGTDISAQLKNCSGSYSLRLPSSLNGEEQVSAS